MHVAGKEEGKLLKPFGFDPLEGRTETAEFVDARITAYHICAAELQFQVDDVLERLNQAEFEKVSDFLLRSCKQLQQSWCSDRDMQLTPPYTEVSAALVHTGCSMADLGLTLQQLVTWLRTNCSPHVAVLRSKECGSLSAAVRSIVSQLVTPTTRTAAGCPFDLGVLAGWYDDLTTGRVTASARPSADAPLARPPASAVGEGSAAPILPVLAVVFEDVEHFAPQARDVWSDLLSPLQPPCNPGPRRLPSGP